MPKYSGSFPLVAQGQPVTVKLDGVALTDPAPGNVGSTVRHGQLVYTYEYAAGDDDTTLLATVPTSAGLLTAYLEFDKTATAASGGGGGAAETDGVGAVFFGGSSITIPLDNTQTFCDFVVSDDPPRAPQRDDLMVIDTDDATTINVVQSGLYTVQMNTPLSLANLLFDGDPAPMQVRVQVQFQVNGDNEPPIYDYNNRAWWSVVEDGQLVTPVALNLTFDQVLLAGDTVRLCFRAIQDGLGSLGGAAHMLPDLTMVLTYRGSVTLPA